MVYVTRSWVLSGRRGLVVVTYNVDSDTYLVRAIEKEYLELSAIVTESAREKYLPLGRRYR